MCVGQILFALPSLNGSLRSALFCWCEQAILSLMPGNREDQLAPYAKKALDEAQHQIDGLRKEIQEAERLKAEAEAELKPVQDAQSRFDSLGQELLLKLICPFCWIKRGQRQSLDPISDNSFRCAQCGEEFDL